MRLWARAAVASLKRAGCSAAGVAIYQVVFAGAASAQAWVPAQGEGSVAITYQNYYTLGHYDLQGRRNTNGATHSKALAVELDYGITDSLAFVIALPFVASKYTGPSSYFVAGIQTFPGPLDDGTYHSDFQDVRVEIRRRVGGGPMAVTPFVGGTVPSHAYETVGEAVPGRGRPELHLGVSVGLPLEQLLPTAYVQTRYALGVSAPEDGFAGVRSLIDLEGGANVLRRVGLRGLLDWQFRNKGPLAPELAADWTHHDRFIVGNFFDAGAGLTIACTESIDVSAVWLQTVSGKNGAHAARVFNASVTWSFGGGFTGFGP